MTLVNDNSSIVTEKMTLKNRYMSKNNILAVDKFGLLVHCRQKQN